MKTKTLLLLFCINFNLVQAWGPTGHRVIGEVASWNISNKTKREIAKLLYGESLASASTFADEIKSDKRYNKFYSWHYVNFDFGKKYEECEHNYEGDVIQGIQICLDTLKSKIILKEDKIFYLKLLVHLVGDLHQPFHIGRKEDKGANDIKLKWFQEPSNLHKVWDEDMINHYNMSYSELSNDLRYLKRTEKKEIQKGTLMDWVYESQKLAQNVYSSAKKDDILGYKYQYEYFPTVKTQLQKGGLRLAELLDTIFK